MFLFRKDFMFIKILVQKLSFFILCLDTYNNETFDIKVKIEIQKVNEIQKVGITSDQIF